MNLFYFAFFSRSFSSVWLPGHMVDLEQPSALVEQLVCICHSQLSVWLVVGLPWSSTSSTSGTYIGKLWSQELQDKLLAEGEAVYVDYTAKWCLSCQVNKRVYGDQEVIDSIAAGNVKLLRADWTKKSAQILKSLQSHGTGRCSLECVLSQFL